MNRSVLKIVLMSGLCLGWVSCSWFGEKFQKEVKPSFYEGFERVEFPSSKYAHSQKAVYLQSQDSLQPLIVSLHTWGGDYLQEDSIALMALKNDWNYIHPDYGGRQWTAHSCCLPASVQDIDDAIAYAIEKGNVDTNHVVVIGKSGGGSGVLAAFLKSRYGKARFYSWSPIPDQISWYNEVSADSALAKRYLQKILLGTDSQDELNIEVAKLKSPSHFQIGDNLNYAERELVIYVGIHDGLDGWSTAITQGMAFYNKLLDGLSVQDSIHFVSDAERQYLIENRTSLIETNELVGNRDMIFKKEYRGISLIFFEGGHEIIYDQVKSDLIFE